MDSLKGMVLFYRPGEYGLIKGEDGKEYCFGRKAVSCRTRLYYGDTVSFKVDENHPILAASVKLKITQTGVRNALSKKGYTLKSEKNNLFSVIVRSHDDGRKVFIKEHMTLPQIVEWVKNAKKLTAKEKNEILQEGESK